MLQATSVCRPFYFTRVDFSDICVQNDKHHLMCACRQYFRNNSHLVNTTVVYRSPDVVVMLDHRLRRWPNIMLALSQYDACTRMWASGQVAL